MSEGRALSLEEQRAALHDLLARIHGDGGHYVDEQGLERAIEDAHYLVAVWRGKFIGEGEP